jgi:hypothetical protein
MGDFGDREAAGDEVCIEERPESVLDTLDNRREDSPPLPSGGGWSKERRVIGPGRDLAAAAAPLPPATKTLTLPDCASAAAV